LKLLVCYFDIINLKQWRKNYNFGIGAISAYLKKNGFDVQLYYISEIPQFEFLKKIFSEYMPDLIGFSFTSAQAQYVKQLAKMFKQISDIPIIAGGIHTIICPDEIINIPEIDMVCVCEGELALAELLTKIAQSSNYFEIDGIWYKSNGKIIKTKNRKYIEDLDIIPFGDRDLFNYSEMYEPKIEKRAPYICSRGCPYDCSYCANKVVRENLRLPSKIRFHSVDYVIEELKYLVKKYEIQYFRFDDDILPINMQWYENFIKKYKERINLPFSCNMRFNLINEEVLKLLVFGGCDQIQIGIESGNEEYRKQFLHRNMSQDMIIKNMKLINKYNLKMYAFNLLGGPEEKPMQILDTIKLNALGNVNMVQLSIMNVYPGTYIYDYCKKNNLLYDDYDKIPSYFDDKPVIKNPYLPFELLIFYKNNFFKLMRFYKKVFRLPQPFMKITCSFFDFMFTRQWIIKIFPIFQQAMYFYRNIRNILLFKPLVKKNAEIIEGVGKN